MRPQTKLLTGIALGTALTIASATAQATVRRVDASAPAPGGDGSTWALAYTYLQDAIAASVSGDQIWVKAGTYKPDEGTTGQTPLNRNESFHLVDGVEVYGGFDGTEATLADRAGLFEQTILSGDIDENDGPGPFDNNANNSYHVVRAGAVGAPTVLDGFWITAGNADGPDAFVNDVGGGMFADGADLVVVGCFFVGNRADSNGGGMYDESAILEMVNCAFLGNRAAGRGGGMANALGSTLTLINCIYSGNSGLRGGAVYNEGANTHTTMVNCTLSANHATINGGGIYNLSSNPVLANCILWNNSDAQGTGQSAQIVGGAPDVSYSCIQDADPDDLNVYPGVGNIDDDPQFVDPDGDDDTVGTADDNLRLGAGSPCVDASDNEAVPPSTTTDLDDNPRILDDPAAADTGNPPWADAIVDMGAYERIIDCNDNGIADTEDLADCDGSAWCQDCNGNGVLDECDVDTTDPDGDGLVSQDCQLDGVPDECEIDETSTAPGGPFFCTENCDPECNDNGVPDECDLPGNDCNTNDSPDECDLAEGTSDDCNGNEVPDECDIAAGTSPDGNGNGIPDECEQAFLLDIKPGSCPNPVNVKSKGVVPVAIVGTASHDVSWIVLDSVRLSRADGVGGEVAPHEGPQGPHSVYEDVATPFDGEPCACHEAEGDDILDLSMKFQTEDVVAVLELDQEDGGTLLELVVTGRLNDGTEFQTSDCIQVVPAKNKGNNESATTNADGAWAPAWLGQCGASVVPAGLLGMFVLFGARLVRLRRIRR
ncbi:MAG: hypothetical protein JSU68_05625 [Phycisphaerales bacterium]|nr:MAG: hypothetical protein JSU68_05625 [Phycisphaerales bacterium]